MEKAIFPPSPRKNGIPKVRMCPYCDTVNVGVANLNFLTKLDFFLVSVCKTFFFTFSVYFLSGLERVGHFFVYVAHLVFYTKYKKFCHT